MIKATFNKIMNLPSWAYWVLLAVIGLLIVIFNDALGDDDSFIVFGLIYFSLLAISLLRWIFSQIRSIIMLKRDKAKMEMLHLKSQVNPHFFFNTLNNLYGLVEKNPKEAQALILKLSDMMRYSIYEGQNEWVTLDEEVTYLKNYIALHEDRYHKKVQVDFHTAIDDQDYRIMPLLLILLVENAFKHGVEKLRNDVYVSIELIANNGRIDFSISNNYDQEESSVHPDGIGIANLKRRLEIGYKKNYKLSINKLDEIFQVQLSLLKV